MNNDRFEHEHGTLLESLRQARGGCPPAERLLEWTTGGTGTGESERIAQHVALCSQCAEAVARSYEAEPEIDELSWRRSARRLDKRKAPWRREGPRAGPIWFSAAAVAVAVFAIVLVYWPDRGTVSPEAPAPTVRGTEIELIEPVGPVSQLTAFRWRGLPAPLRYRVEVAEADDDSRSYAVIWTQLTPDTRIAPDPAFEALLTAGGRYRWRVVVVDAEGQELSSSAWVAFAPDG